ncbi:hypothetical protein P3L10_031088 [Capsicum annuum]
MADVHDKGARVETVLSIEHYPGCNISNCTAQKCFDQENGELSATHNETQPRNTGSLVEEGLSESVSVCQHKGERHDDVNGQDGKYVEFRVENCITTLRERIKATSECKKALKEELVSRQRALEIQSRL